MEHVLLIHMGRHKTGTTALQSFLYANRKRLEEYGWCYPDLKRELPGLSMWPPGGGTEKNGACFFSMKKIHYPGGVTWERGEIDTKGEEWGRIWEQIQKHLKEKNVIVSEEALWYRAEPFLAGAKEKYGNIKVLVYLRRQDRAMESWWNQMVKGGRCSTKTFREYLDSAADGGFEVAEGFHYLKKLNRLREIVGRENLIVRVYEKQQLEGAQGILSDFLSVLGITPDWEKWKKYPMKNLRLTGNYIEIKRVYNSVKDAGYLGLRELAHVFSGLSFQHEKGESGYFTTEKRKKFMEQFEAENRQIAREYLHREDGILFCDDRMEYPIEEIHACSSFEEDLIRTFSAMVCRQQDEIRQLRGQNYMLVRKMMLQNQKGRKLLLFGAGQRCRELLEQIRLPAVCVADNDREKCGHNTRGGVSVVFAESIFDWEEYFVVVTCVKTDEIEKQLQALGLKKEENYILAKEYLEWPA